MTIDEAFLELINSKKAETDLDIEPMELLKFRIAIRNGSPISTDLKIELLFRCGWEQNLLEYTPGDLASVLRYGQKKKVATRN